MVRPTIAYYMKDGGLIKIVVAVLMLMFAQTAHSAGKYEHLKYWVGRYPSKGPTRENREFLKLPEIRAILLQLLPGREYRRLTKTLAVETPIEMIDDYLVVRRCRPHCCPCENALLLVGLHEDTVLVLVYDSSRGKDDESATKCFSTGRQLFELSDNLKERALEMHIPRMTADDKLLPKNPWINRVKCSTPNKPNQ